MGGGSITGPRPADRAAGPSKHDEPALEPPMKAYEEPMEDEERKTGGELKKTVVLESEELTKKKIEILTYVKTKYEEILRQAIEFGLRNKTTSPYKLIAGLRRELGEKYKELPSNYIVTACRDAATRLESFKKLRRRGEAKGERPEVKKVAIWLDSQLFELVNDFTIRVTTHEGPVFIPIKPHKLYWIYKNRGWNIASEARIGLEDNKAIVYLILRRGA